MQSFPLTELRYIFPPPKKGKENQHTSVLILHYHNFHVLYHLYLSSFIHFCYQSQGGNWGADKTRTKTASFFLSLHRHSCQTRGGKMITLNVEDKHPGKSSGVEEEEEEEEEEGQKGLCERSGEWKEVEECDKGNGLGLRKEEGGESRSWGEKGESNVSRRERKVRRGPQVKWGHLGPHGCWGLKRKNEINICR